MVDSVIQTWRGASDRERLLKVIQPGLIGLIDGTVSTLAPIFAAAYLAGSRAALLVGLAAGLGAAISMGLSEALSDDGSLTGRGTSALERTDHRRGHLRRRHRPRAPVPDRRPRHGLADRLRGGLLRAGGDRLGSQAVSAGRTRNLADPGDGRRGDRGDRRHPGGPGLNPSGSCGAPPPREPAQGLLGEPILAPLLWSPAGTADRPGTAARA